MEAFGGSSIPQLKGGNTNIPINVNLITTSGKQMKKLISDAFS